MMIRGLAYQIKKTGRAFLLGALLFLPALTAAANPTLAVSPFNNISGQDNLDYIGFQVSEYLTTAYSSFSNITLVERSNLVEILKEQELQLSGITDSGRAVQVGQILNARYMVLGSYSVNGSTLRISARVTDVQNGEVITAEAVQGRQDTLFPLLKQLFFKMVAGMKTSGSTDFADWSITVPVEARVASLEDQGEESSAQFARALEASFRENEEEALSLLQETISGSQMNFSSYAGAADEYLETYKKVQKIESETFYTRMLKRQIDTNKQLLAEAEKATLYRNTLKILYQRMRDTLKPSLFQLDVGTAYQFEEGTVSMKIVPPSDITIAANPALEQTFRQLVAQQDILAWQGALKLGFQRFPEMERLMTAEGMDSLFEFSLYAEMDYAVQFISPSGEVVYELVPGAPAVPFSLADGQLKTAVQPAEIYSEAFPRDGWSYREGKVEIQARELKNLSDVRVVLKPESFQPGGTFLMEQDRVWKSLVMHSYRQQYVKITGGEEDPCPQVKEAVVTDHMLNFPGYPVDRVPLLIEKRPLARFANLTGVVYWADSSHTLVEGHWRGAVYGQSKTVRGELTPQSVLYFPLSSSPEDFWNISEEESSFTVKNEGKKKTVTFRVGLGMAFFQDEDGPYKLLATEDGLFGTGSEGTFRYDPRTGEILWQSSQDGEALAYDGDFLYVTDSDSRVGTSCFRAEDGTLVWNKENLRGKGIIESGNHVFVSGSNSTHCLDKVAGTALWSNRESNRSLVMAGDRVFTGDAFLNRVTGEEESDISGYRRTSHGVVAGEGRVYVSLNNGIEAWDPRGMKKIWSHEQEGSEMVLAGDYIYMAESGDGTSCLKAETGELLWKNGDADGDDLAVMDGMIFVAGGNIYALSALSGDILWEGNFSAADVAVREGLVYFTNSSDDFWAVDPDYFYRDVPDVPVPSTAQSRAPSFRLGSGVRGSLEAGGAKWFRLDIPETMVPHDIKVSVEGQGDFDPEFRVYEESGRYRNKVDEWYGVIVYRPQSFYIKVEGESYRRAGSFHLKAESRGEVERDPYEPDWRANLASLYNGEPQEHNFSAYWDWDWVVFSVDSEQTYRITAVQDTDKFHLDAALFETEVDLATARSFPESFDYTELPGWDEIKSRENRKGQPLTLEAQLTPGKAYYLRIKADLGYYAEKGDVQGTSYTLSIEPVN